MKKKIGIIVVIVLICILLLVLFLMDSTRKSLKFTVIENDSCSEEEYYFDYEGRKVYLDCIKQITIEKNHQSYDFKEAIEKKIVTLDEVLENANRTESFWDGGTVEYFFDDFKIITYQKTFNCNDIVIGNVDMEMKENCISS